jgi:hypothetical protein
MVGTLLGAPVTATWAHLPNIPHNLGALGGLDGGAALEHSAMPFWGPPGPSCGGVARSNEGLEDRQVPTKKMEWTQEKGKMT